MTEHDQRRSAAIKMLRDIFSELQTQTNRAIVSEGREKDWREKFMHMEKLYDAAVDNPRILHCIFWMLMGGVAMITIEILTFKWLGFG